MTEKDTRVTMKVERALWEKIDSVVNEHPEWGIVSVPDFVRRAIDSELRRRAETDSRRTIHLRFTPEGCDEDEAR
jgi:hypothetical protein